MNSLSILIFLCILPVILILIFVYEKDKKKEPALLLLQLFLLGISCCFIVIYISDIIRPIFPFMQGKLTDKSFIDILLYSFIGVALVEEFCKWIMLYFFGYKSREFDEIYDIIVYAIFVSLGFAFYENIAYILFNNASIKTALLRAISAVPSHACDAVFMGYYLSIAKRYAIRGKQKLERKNIILSIIIPTLLHGIYDFCIMSGMNVFKYIFIIFVVYLFMMSVITLKEVSTNNTTIAKK